MTREQMAKMGDLESFAGGKGGPPKLDELSNLMFEAYMHVRLPTPSDQRVSIGEIRQYLLGRGLEGDFLFFLRIFNRSDGEWMDAMMEFREEQRMH